MNAATDADFLAGRDLAVRMLRHMDDADVNDDAGIEAQHRRDGNPQRNHSKAYLAELIVNPRLLEGFAAVMTDGLHGRCFADADVYARLTLSEMLGPKHDAALQGFIASLSRPGSAPAQA